MGKTEASIFIILKWLDIVSDHSKQSKNKSPTPNELKAASSNEFPPQVGIENCQGGSSVKRSLRDWDVTEHAKCL